MDREDITFSYFELRYGDKALTCIEVNHEKTNEVQQIVCTHCTFGPNRDEIGGQFRILLNALLFTQNTQ